MKVVALISGGKDSCYNMLQCVSEEHEITALANLYPVEKDELDSYMFQTVGHHAIDLYSEAMNVPLFRRAITGGSVEQGLDYEKTEDDEVEDLYELLKDIKDKLNVEGVSVGAILSDYQRVRVEHVCARLGLTPLAFLWRMDQTELLQEMIDCDVNAILIKVAALGLTPNRHLGKSLKEIQPHMAAMKLKYGLNECGEGGEYETFTLDCPLFKKKIVVDEMSVVTHSDDAFAPVAYINFGKMHLEDKTDNVDVGICKRKSDSVLNEVLNASELQLLRSNEMQVRRLSVDQKRCTRSESKLSESGCVYENEDGFVWISDVKSSDTTGDMSAVAKELMDLLGEKLGKLDLTFSHLIAVHLYVSDMSKFGEINSVYKQYFGINPPIRICVEGNIPNDIGILLDCIAYRSKETRQTMHVQGISHWAPANIGPYSQATVVGGKIYVAGQIALCPATMQIIEGGILPECRLSLRHVSRILAALKCACTFENVMTAVCYVTDETHLGTAKREWEQASRNVDGVNPLCQFVVIPALPRGALVEWQVVALDQIQERKNISSGFRGALFEVSARYQMINATDDRPQSLKSCIDVFVNDSCDIESEISAMWSSVFSLTAEKVQHLSMKFTDLDCPRIFYDCNRISAQTFGESYFDNMGKWFDVDKCFASSFIPVSQVNSTKAMFSVLF